MFPLATIAANAALGVGKALVGEVAAAASKPAVSSAQTADASKLRKTATDFEKMFLEQSFDRIAKSEG
ncbi:hypothetical protein, partial [Serratia marcescens]